MERDYDLVVIGGGAAGMAAARTGARRRAGTLLISESPLGGDCTFTGCIPSKTIIEAAARRLPFESALSEARRVVAAVAATEGDEVFRREGIDVVHARASFRSNRLLDVGGRQVAADRMVLATGAEPALPSIPGLAATPYLTNETVFDLTERPATLAVLGGGAIGCELAQAFSRLGVAVTVVEALPRLLPQEEPEASEVIADAFAAEGISVHTGRRVTGVGTRLGGAVCLDLDGDVSLAADRLLVAVGRSPATAGLNLEAAGIATDEGGWVRTDDHLATTAAGIFAAGDVTGRLPFTHAADEMGRIAATNALSRRSGQRFDTSAIPWVTFTDPEVARVGATEADVARRRVRVAHLPMSAVDRAVTAGATRGFVKLLAGPRPVVGNLGGGRILGATIVAARGGEMIHEAALAMRTGMFTGRLVQTVHAYPTWSLALRQAATQFFMELDGRKARPARHSPATTARRASRISGRDG